MGEKKSPKKPLIYYYLVAILIIYLFNSVIAPMYFSPKVKEISYGNFLQKVDEGQVSKVEITSTKIAVVAKDDTDKTIYVTGRIEDPDLVNRLVKSKVEFQSEEEKLIFQNLTEGETISENVQEGNVRIVIQKVDLHSGLDIKKYIAQM